MRRVGAYARHALVTADMPSAVDGAGGWGRALGRDKLVPAEPGGHDREKDDPDEQRDPRAVEELGQVRSEERELHGQKQPRAEDRKP